MDERPRFAKTERRKLRELAGMAYETELGEALGELERDFQRWRSRELEAWELSERIHEFHNGEARELFNLYNNVQEPELVARAVAFRLIDRTTIAPSLLDKLESWIGFYRDSAAGVSGRAARNGG